MSGTVSRLFAASRQAEIEFEIALKAQYGARFEDYRWDSSSYNPATQEARKAKGESLAMWSRAARGLPIR